MLFDEARTITKFSKAANGDTLLEISSGPYWFENV